MAEINVAELLLDPDFVDDVTIISRTPTVNSYGENSLSETSVATVGSVQPASGKSIQRLPDALRVADMSSFWVQGTITADASGRYTDLLTFRGRRYQVVTVLDWTNFGDGWCEGLCVAEKPSQ